MIKDKRPYKVLVIEDNPGDFVLVETFLREQILDPLIEHAKNFKTASEILSGGNISFDVILLDLSLPDRSGQHLITDMFGIADQTPIIILTGYADIDFSTNSISQGISDYLIKDELSAAILYKSILYAIERKKIISDLKDSEKRYSDLFHLSPQPMWVYEMETYRFTQVNDAAIRLYGYSEAEFLTMSIMDIRPAEDIEKTLEIIDKLSRQDIRFYEGRFRHFKKSGELMEVDIFGAPIVINHKNYVSVIAVDVTEKNLNEYKITKAIIKTQEDERYEIGAELHDNVCQILAAGKLTLGMLEESLQPNGLQWYNQCNDYIVLASDEIRNLSHRLAPAFFDDTTMEDAFNRLFKTFNLTGKYKIILEFDDSVKRYPIALDIQLNLYRILQEQLRNILKYASATVVEVDVLIESNKLKIIISDNGVGFDVNKVKGGIGLANMKRRAELFAGKFELNSAPGMGCTIKVDIPLAASNLDKPVLTN